MTVKEFCASRHIYRQVDFAKRTGLSKAYVHQLWTGKRLIGRRMARRLSPLLNASPQILLVLEPPPDALEDADTGIPGHSRA
jgi:plasmid maintenance system antidote protein VapI